MKWMNEPPQFAFDGQRLDVTSAGQTDFWRKTHDHGVRDNGHFFYQSVSGDFSVSVQVDGDYRDQYDQAGLMLRRDASCWLKCGVEWKDGVPLASTVVTRDFSDWSVISLDQLTPMRWQIVRHGGTVETYFSVDERPLQLMRQAHLCEAATLDVGMMIAAPKGRGFSARFDDFLIQTIEGPT